MRLPVLSAAVGTALSIGSPTSSQAQDADFGCKVLLCAAASKPVHAVDFPIASNAMNQLHAMMRSSSLPLPVCTAAGTGAPGFRALSALPCGWQETSSNTGAGGNGVSASLPYGGNDLCARRLPPDPTGRPVQASVPGGQVQCFSSSGDHVGVDGPGQMCVEYRPRPRNERPYYFDVRNPDGVATRVWFTVR